MTSWRELNPLLFAPVTLVLVLSLLAVSLCGSSIVAMFFLRTDFAIERAYKVCEQPLNNRCVSHYTIRSSDGGIRDLVPFGQVLDSGDFFEGAHITKRNVGFDYSLNGIARRWPSLREQWLLFSGGAVGLVVWWSLRGPDFLRLWLDRAFHRSR